MDIGIDKVTDLIFRLREVNVKEGNTDPESGSNPTDDGSTDVLMSGADDASASEIRNMIGGLNDDERADLLALFYVGRGDMEPEEWDDAVAFARERNAAGEGAVKTLLGVPLSADYLEDGVDKLGLTIDAP